MSQHTLLKNSPSSTSLSLSLKIMYIDEIFPGFQPGDFALLYGSRGVQSLATLLSIRAQLPVQLGGLASNVIFIDGGNSFQLYQTTRLAKMCQLNPNQTLGRIYISRAFTAYQITELILHKLDLAVKACNTKLVIISDLPTMFLDEDVDWEEARQIYSQINIKLKNFAKDSQTIVIATMPMNSKNPKNNYFKAITKDKANVVLALRHTKGAREVILEKHSTFKLGSKELPSQTLPLTAFLEASVE